MYFDIYNLLSTFIYGSDAVLTEWMELTLTLMSTIGVLFVVAVPFFVVGFLAYSVIMFIGRVFG